MRTGLQGALLQAATAASSTSDSARRLTFVPESHTDFIFSVKRDRVSIAVVAVVVLLLVIAIVTRRVRRSGVTR